MEEVGAGGIGASVQQPAEFCGAGAGGPDGDAVPADRAVEG